MRSEYIRIYKSVHTWTGIVAGMALFIAFYAGALTIFKEPIARWAAPPSTAYGSALALDAAPTLITRTLHQQPAAAKDFRLHLHAAEHLPSGLSWQRRAPGEDEHDSSTNRHYIATLDIAGGPEVAEAHSPGLINFIDSLHRVVGLPADTDPNRWVMGIIAILYTLALVSGLIVLLPSLVKDFFALRLGKNLKRMWLDAHNVVGIASLPFHLVMALTAIVFAYHDAFYLIQNRLMPAGQARVASVPINTSVQHDPAQMLAPRVILARAHVLAPAFEANTLQYLNVLGARPIVRIWGHDPAAHAPRFNGGFMAFDPYSGKLLNADFLPGQQSNAYALIGAFFALHFGSYGGELVRWVYFLLGLAGAWLFYSGNLLWLESRRKRTVASGMATMAQRRDARLLASTTVGVCLGAVAGLSLTIVTAKWLHGHVDSLQVWHSRIYYSVFIGALGWAIWRGAARAAIDLLWLAAISTLAIPTTSFLAWTWPALGLWVHTSNASLGVDATALFGGTGLCLMAWRTRQRAINGPTDSVWSLKSATSA